MRAGLVTAAWACGSRLPVPPRASRRHSVPRRAHAHANCSLWVAADRGGLDVLLGLRQVRKEAEPKQVGCGIVWQLDRCAPWAQGGSVSARARMD